MESTSSLAALIYPIKKPQKTAAVVCCAHNVAEMLQLWHKAWWRHKIETFSALLAICAGNSPVPREFPTQRPVTRSFDVYFDLRPNKLSKQCWGWYFETQSCSLWRHRNGSSHLSLFTARKMTNRCLSGKLWYLQHKCVGDIIVYH